MSFKLHRLLPSLVIGLLLPGPAVAQVAPERSDPLNAFSRFDERLAPTRESDRLEDLGPALDPEVRSGWEAFQRFAAGVWHGYVDRLTGKVESAEGAGIPWIPGNGNNLSLTDIAHYLNGEPQVDLPTLERIARAFLPRVVPILGVDPADLVLDSSESGPISDHVWRVVFDVVHGELPVEGTRVIFAVNNGNLVQFGTMNLPFARAQIPRIKVTKEEALSALSSYIGGFGALDTFLDSGSLHLLPAAPRGGLPASGSARGRGLLLAWQFVFRREGADGTWRSRIDATTGKVLEFRDINEYARTTGGIYLDPYIPGNEIELPMPFADLSSGGFTSSAGTYTAGSVTTTLAGQYTRIVDLCGPISLPSNSAGDLLFGTSGGLDCATPGVGGTGNTHSSRTQFYHVNRAKEIGRGWLPSNSWLNGVLTANVNVNKTCNAFWDGITLNFFRSGNGCANTGEMTAVSLHEFGHGLDWNDGNGTSVDRGTGETYGDFTAALLTRNSCMGDGFYTTHGRRCDSATDPCTSCTGVRDIDWGRHASGTPHTVNNWTRPFCPYDDDYPGPCFRQGHCESQISSEALWDFAARDLPNPGSTSAWFTAERLWYLSRPAAYQAFLCTFTDNPWTSSGCGTGTYWRAMRLVDDDDGNLANGTPHSCHLFAAFDRHGIACASDPGADVCLSSCSPPAVPAVNLFRGINQVVLSWAAGAGAVYDIYRSELGCDSGFVKIADNLTVISYLDTQVSNGFIYRYRIVAQSNGNVACSAAPSACQIAPLLGRTDVWSKDLPADTSTEPDPATAGQPMWTSPDIWVRKTQTPGPHEDPEFGQINYVHVTVRNRTTVPGINIPVEVYAADSARWQESGQEGVGVKVIGHRKIEILDAATAFIMIPMAGREEFDVGMAFEDTAPRKATETQATVTYGFEVVQEDVENGDTIGGITYEIQARGHP